MITNVKMNESAQNLNMVTGFDPMKYARILNEGTNEEQLYLDVMLRVLWFRLYVKEGRIETEIIKADENMALVKATIYLNPSDPPVANSYGQRYCEPDDPIRKNHVENAETAAIGRALAKAGFGCQLGALLEQDPDIVDAGARIRHTDKRAEQPAEPPKTEPAPPRKTKTANPAPAPVENNPTPKAEPPQVTAPPKQAPVTATASPKESLPVTEALKYQLQHGRLAGKTLQELLREDYDALVYYATDYAGRDAKLKEYARIVVDSAEGSQEKAG